VREFVELAGAKLDMKIKWHKTGVDEYGCDENGDVVVRVDSRYFRPTEVETLLGDATKAREKLGWSPKISFDELVAEMVESDLRIAKRDALIQREGYQAFSYNE
jgi:GDPmannose 4,6-dehydratase